MELFSSVVRPLESVSMAFELGGRKGGEGRGCSQPHLFSRRDDLPSGLLCFKTLVQTERKRVNGEGEAAVLTARQVPRLSVSRFRSKLHRAAIDADVFVVAVGCACQKTAEQSGVNDCFAVITVPLDRNQPPASLLLTLGENTQLKRSPFKAWSRSVYSHTCYAYCQGLFPCRFLPFRSIPLHFFQNLSLFFLCWLWLTHGFLCGPAE